MKRGHTLAREEQRDRWRVNVAASVGGRALGRGFWVAAAEPDSWNPRLETRPEWLGGAKLGRSPKEPVVAPGDRIKGGSVRRQGALWRRQTCTLESSRFWAHTRQAAEVFQWRYHEAPVAGRSLAPGPWPVPACA